MKINNHNGNLTRRRLWEAGHFYQAKGPTKWTQLSWQIMTKLSQPSDFRLMLVDDVHNLSDMHKREQNEVPVCFQPTPKPNKIILESELEKSGQEILERLKILPRKKRTRKRGKDGRWICSGSLLTASSGKPMCLLYDLGLTWHKYHHLGFKHIINVLPEFYYSEQHALMRISPRIMPDLTLETVLFNLQGHWRLLRL